MLTCTQAQTLIIRTIDDQSLSADARVILRQHLSVCANCRDEYETQHEVRRLLALQIEDRLPPGFTERLNARLARQKPKARRTRRHPDAPATIGARDASQGEPHNRPAMASAAMPASASTAPASLSASAQAPALRSEPFTQTSWRRGPSWGVWTARLIPVAATLALIVADGRFRASMPPPPEPSFTSSSADSSASTASTMMPGDAPVRRRDHDRPSTDALHQPARPTSAPGTIQATTIVLPKDAQELVPASAGDSRAALLRARAVTGSASASTAATSSVSLESAPIDLTLRPLVLTPDVAEELKLSGAQRKQIAEIYDSRRHAFHEILENTRKRVEIERHETDAAIERVLTREQRKQYRERLASQGSTILQTTPAPLPDPARSGMPSDRSVVPGPTPRSPISPTSPSVPPFDWR